VTPRRGQRGGGDDLRLNSLDRFTKRSPRLLLEEHAHCEVPAGCGGVVLRWVNPAAALPILIDFYHPGPARLAIDGVTVTTSHLLLAPGPHVLALEFPQRPADGSVLFALVGRFGLAREGWRDETVIVRSTAGRAWLCTTTPPPGWDTAVDPPPGDWSRLPERRAVEPERGSTGSFAFYRAVERGHAVPIGVPRRLPAGPIHVRTVFVVPSVRPT
jgi:hypothetical protein